jgi:hypothetical protein
MYVCELMYMTTVTQKVLEVPEAAQHGVQGHQDWRPRARQSAPAPWTEEHGTQVPRRQELLVRIWQPTQPNSCTLCMCSCSERVCHA